MRFTGKTCAVTGAAGGIGLAVARRFALEGARSVLFDIDAVKVAEAAKTLKAEGLQAEGRVLDVTDSAAVSVCMHRLAEEGRLDVWVNNAGIYPQRELCEMTESQWDGLMTVNVKSVWLCTKEAATVMKAQGGGIILQAASFASLIGSAGSGGYAATKSAVLSLTKTFAAELAPFGIRVCAYIPGVIQTGMTQGVIDRNRAGLVDGIALRRLGKPDDVAGVVAFLASDDAAYLTGNAIEVSGGKLCVQNPGYSWALHGVANPE